MNALQAYRPSYKRHSAVLSVLAPFRESVGCFNASKRSFAQQQVDIVATAAPARSGTWLATTQLSSCGLPLRPRFSRSAHLTSFAPDREPQRPLAAHPQNPAPASFHHAFSTPSAPPGDRLGAFNGSLWSALCQGGKSEKFSIRSVRKQTLRTTHTLHPTTRPRRERSRGCSP